MFCKRFSIWVMLSICVSLFCRVPANAEFRFISERESGSLIIFIHGLGGDALGSFTAEGSKSWPELMSSDAKPIGKQKPLSEYSIATLSYPAKEEDGLRIPDIVRHLLDELEQSRVDDKYDEVFFIAHSLGGLVLQDLLSLAKNRASTSSLIHRVKAVFFLAVPGRGVPMQPLEQFLRTLALGHFVEDLSPQHRNSYIMQLTSNWNSFLASDEGRRIFIYCAYETKPYGLISGIIVPAEYSTNERCIETPLGFNEDHVSIAKPSNRQSRMYSWVKGRLASMDRLRERLPDTHPERPKIFETPQQITESPSTEEVRIESPSAEPVNLRIIEDIQTVLKDRKCYDGRIDGIWGRKSHQALMDFRNGLGNFELGNEPSLELLMKIKDYDKKVCVRRHSPPVKRAKCQGEPPDPSSYSYSIWPARTVPTGATIRRSTCWGILVCVGSTPGGPSRPCRWE